jgi:hypothetical protein
LWRQVGKLADGNTGEMFVVIGTDCLLGSQRSASLPEWVEEPLTEEDGERQEHEVVLGKAGHVIRAHG